MTTSRGWFARNAGALLIVGLVVAAVLYVGSSWWDRFDGLAGPEQGVLVRLERDGPCVNEDRGLERWLAGRAAVPDSTVQAAFCVNGPLWITDETLSNVLMVSTSE